MDTRLRNHYGAYDCNKSAALVEHDPRKTCRLPSSICDLDNEIHSMFRPINFPGARDEVLRPALQVASLLVDTDCSLGFWDAVFFGKRNPGTSRRGSDFCSRKTLHYYRRGPELSAKQKAETVLKLESPSRMFRFYRSLELGSAVAMCWYAKGESLGLLKETFLFRHRIDDVGYHESRYQRLCDAFDKATVKGWTLSEAEVTHLQRKYLSFAVVLVHELAHVAIKA